MKSIFISALLMFVPILASADDSGSCGESVTYYYEESTHTLTITGEGPMKDYPSFYRSAPWASYSDNIANVVIEEGVTFICGQAFKYCNALNSIKIPNSIISIGPNAFEGTPWYDNQPDGVVYIGKVAYKYKGTMPDNTSIYIKEGTVSISDYAFENKKGLVSLMIPNSTEAIGMYAFYCCSALNSISIPNTCLNIGVEAFNFTAWYDNQPDGVVYIGKVAYKYKGTMPDNTSIILEEGTGAISNSAFISCKGLKSLTIPNSLLSIGNCCFQECINLTDITLGNNLKTIGSGAFFGCSALSSISIPNSVTTIEKGVFNGCSSLSSIEIPDGVSSIESNAFKDCSSINTLSLPNSLKSIGEYAFSGCSSLSRVNVLCVPTSISNYIFKDCSNINEVTFDCDSVTDIFRGVSSITNIAMTEKVSKIGNYSFSGFSSLSSIILPSSLVSIGEYSFYNCSSLSSIEIPSNVTSIGVAAFQDCTNLSSINIPSNIKKLSQIVGGCTNMEKLIIEQSSEVLVLTDNGLQGPFKELYLGRNVSPEYINNNNIFMPFRGCGISTLIIGKDVTFMDPCYFEDCINISKIIFEDGEEELQIGEFGRIYNPFSNFPIQEVYLGRNIKEGSMTAPLSISNNFSIKISNSLSILNKIFNSCTGITEVNIPDNITTISSGAFSGCSGLKNITIPKSVKMIGGNVFSGCTQLESVTLPEDISLISYGLFNDCKSLKTIKIPDSVNSIEGWAFNNCESLLSVIIPQGVETIEGRTFYGCKSLKKIIIPSSVTTIQSWAFAECSNLDSLVLEDGKESLIVLLGNNPAFQNSPIKYVYLGREIINNGNISNDVSITIGNMSIISDNTLSNFRSGVSSIIIPNTVAQISSSAFSNCTSLTTVKFEDGNSTLEFLDESGFYRCNLTNLYLGRNISFKDGKSPFRYNKEALTNITIGDQVTEIEESQFVGLKSVTTIELPSSLKKIGKQAFYGCEALTSISIPNTVTELGQDAFDMTRSLTSFTIEDGDIALSINNNFLNSPLSEIYVGRNITYTEGNSPFSMLESLSKLSLGNKVTTIGKTEYAGCKNLKDVVSYADNIPTTGQNVFTESYLPNATLHVLDSSSNAYKATYPWSMFGKLALINEDGEEKYIIKGDATNDGKVNAEDIVEVTNYIMGNASDNFNLDAADTNGDCEVNAADIIKIVNIILFQE